MELIQNTRPLMEAQEEQTMFGLCLKERASLKSKYGIMPQMPMEYDFQLIRASSLICLAGLPKLMRWLILMGDWLESRASMTSR